ncbi:MAG: hypothetical protein JXB03_04835 [Spirochaetales bacterium]|nr:hypothetical protein [Spirochaetales bacterium]
MEKGNKKQLLKRLADEPKDFSLKDIDRLRGMEGFSAGDVRPVLADLLDIGDGIFKNNSAAAKGIVGFFNRMSRWRRKRIFERRLKDPRVDTVIVAEGDSWLEHPVGIRDILDHLIKRRNYGVYSLAFAGDWIANICTEGEYVDALVRINPDVFMVSGGGNDILDDMRLARLIKKRQEVPAGAGADLSAPEGRRTFADACLNDRFHLLMKVFSLLYRYLFDSVSSRLGPDSRLKIITQGYDYGVPSTRKGWSLLRWVMDNGRWLYKPLVRQGYRDRREQQAVINGMIDHFNEMLIQTGADLPGVIHMDLRGAVERFGTWFDEIHPTSATFGIIAKAFRACIDSDDAGIKVWTARDMDLS